METVVCRHLVRAEQDYFSRNRLPVKKMYNFILFY